MKPTVICLCPVRNEAWILDRFLSASSCWADHIVVLDQGSTDGTVDIAKRYPKATVHTTPDLAFDESARRTRLLDIARSIPAEHRILVALDADEFLSADLIDSPEWKSVLESAPGTTTLARWVNLYDGLRRAHVCDFNHLLAYSDDGRALDEYFIHGPRLPMNPQGPHLQVNQGKVLHFQYLNWQRMKSKHRWYQCLEALRYPDRSSIAIYRQYHHMDVPCSRYDPVDARWFDGYRHAAVDITTFSMDPRPWFDREVLNIFDLHGAKRFSKLAIWDTDWVHLASVLGMERPDRFRDPRSSFESRVHRWLASSQSPDRIFRFSNRLKSALLRGTGW